MRSPSRSERRRSGGLLAYLLLLVSLQVFLLVVALEGVLGHDFALARNAAVLSAVVFVSAAAIRWFVGHD
ncbi:MAG: hypothetical protein H6517_09030 [Microthrixaceae bacterium]|nr:hypothetical protein [Microthrixaceae bacterium]MCB9387955.1 hypothetical protein [Microthrixaceae bacterium]MCO5322192.1 hypothetical protein [Microthrixaceae bacterium]